MRTTRWASSAAIALTLAMGCIDRRAPLPPDGTAPRTLAMGLNLELRGSLAVGERVVDIHARYRRANGEQPTLPVQPSRVALQTGLASRSGGTVRWFTSTRKGERASANERRR